MLCCSLLPGVAAHMGWYVSRTCAMCGAHSQTGHSQFCSGILLALASLQSALWLSHGLGAQWLGVPTADRGPHSRHYSGVSVDSYREFLLGLWELRHTKENPLLRIMRALLLMGWVRFHSRWWYEEKETVATRFEFLVIEKGLILRIISTVSPPFSGLFSV